MGFWKGDTYASNGGIIIDPLDYSDQQIKAHRDEAMVEMQEVLNHIFLKPLENLTKQDKGFIRARQDYLTAGQRETYAKIIGETNEPEPYVSKKDQAKP